MCLTFHLYSDTGNVNTNIPEDVITNIIQACVLFCSFHDDVTVVFLNSCQEVQVEAAGDLDGLEGHR